MRSAKEALNHDLGGGSWTWQRAGVAEGNMEVDMFVVKVVPIALFLVGCAGFVAVLFLNWRLLDAQRATKIGIWQRLRIAGINPFSPFQEARWPDENCRRYVRGIRFSLLVTFISFSMTALLVWLYSLFGVIR